MFSRPHSRDMAIASCKSKSETRRVLLAEIRFFSNVPEVRNGLDQAFEGNCIGGFDHISVRAQGVSAVNIICERRRRENDDGNEPRNTVGTYPPEDLETTDNRHFKIEHDQVGNRKSPAVAVFACATEIVNGLVTTADDLQGMRTL